MPEQDPSRFEAMKQGIHEAFTGGMEALHSGIDSLRQNADRLKAIGQITLVGAGAGTGIGLALPAAVSAEGPVAHSSDTPAAEATASDQTQDCVNDAFKIKIIGSVMNYPGDRRKQSVGTAARLDPVSPDCLPLINRETPQIFFKMQRPKNHKKWTKTKDWPMRDGSNDPIDGNVGGKGAAFVETNPKSPFRDSKFRYRCTPGKGITHVRAVYKLKVDSAVDGNTLGRRTYSVPVKIHSVSGIVLGGGVAKAC